MGRSGLPTSPARWAGTAFRSPARRSASARASPAAWRRLSAQLEWATALRTPVLMDAAKARRELRWEPRFDAAETLLQTAVSARESGLLD